MLLTIFFILFLQGPQFIQASELCEYEDPLPSVISNITKWLINGYKSTKSTGCKDDLVMADCMASFFGLEPPKCYPEYLSKQIYKDLPTCSKLLHQGKFKDIVGNGQRKSIQEIFHQISRAAGAKGLDEMELCENLEEYMKHRLEASDGGKFQRKKLDVFCYKNKEKCEAADEFFNNSTEYLKNYVDLFKKPTNGNYVSALIDIDLKINSVYKYAKQDPQLVTDFKKCIKEFFAVAIAKLK